MDIRACVPENLYHWARQKRSVHWSGRGGGGGERDIETNHVTRWLWFNKRSVIFGNLTSWASSFLIMTACCCSEADFQTLPTYCHGWFLWSPGLHLEASRGEAWEDDFRDDSLMGTIHLECNDTNPCAPNYRIKGEKKKARWIPAFPSFDFCLPRSGKASLTPL